MRGENRERLRIDRAIIVEGKYDKIKLSSIVDALIITTEGFGIFKEKEKIALIRRIAAEKGIILLTDPDGAGLVIRNYLRSAVDGDRIIHLYVPDIEGKERRKKEYSREGLLGVEGMDISLLYDLLMPYSNNASDGKDKMTEPLTRLRFYEDGFSGGENSAERREGLALALSLPRNISAKAMIEAINMLGGLPLYEEAIINLGETYE